MFVGVCFEIILWIAVPYPIVLGLYEFDDVYRVLHVIGHTVFFDDVAGYLGGLTWVLGFDDEAGGPDVGGW